MVFTVWVYKSGMCPHLGALVPFYTVLIAISVHGYTVLVQSALADLVSAKGTLADL